MKIILYACNGSGGFFAEKILALKPDGIFLSNGSSDPKDLPTVIAEVKKLLEKRPIFGICLGHQILALAFGANTYKLITSRSYSHFSERRND